MSKNDEAYGRLLSLLRETLAVSERLKRFTRQRQDVLSGGDEKKILETLREREKIIDELTNPEYEIERLLDTLGLDLGSLPPEAEALRLAIRSELSAVTETDVSAINVMRGHLQEYKDLTIRLRNKKHVSAYLKSYMFRPQANRFDAIK